MKKLLTTALLVLTVTAAVASAAETPIWVHQPAYDGMSFYVYKPASITNGWYVTYDGYPVYKTWNGTWIYGTRTAEGILPTNYVVGSVVPSVVGLVPWVRDAQPATGVPQMVPVQQSVPVPVAVADRSVTYMPPAPNGEVSQVPQLPVLAPVVPVNQAPVSFAYVPAWMADPNFMSVVNWKIDRVGVLNRPAIPVAWSGHMPEVIYAWTGRSWQQVDAANKTVISALRGALYALARRANYEHLNWGGADTTTLAGCAATWGCRWMGEIIVNENF